MIRKSIASILIVLILINGIGCYSFQDVKVEDAETNKKYTSVKLTTLDDKVYYLIEVEVRGTIIKGIDSNNYQRGIIEFRAEDIKKIEVIKYDAGLTLLTLVGVVGASIGLLYLLVALLFLPK